MKTPHRPMTTLGTTPVSRPQPPGQLALTGPLTDDQQCLQDLQGRQRETPHDLHDGEVACQALGECVKAAWPRRGDGVRAVGQDTGQAFFVKGRQPAEQVIVHQRSLRGLAGLTRKPP